MPFVICHCDPHTYSFTFAYTSYYMQCTRADPDTPHQRMYPGAVTAAAVMCKINGSGIKTERSVTYTFRFYAFSLVLELGDIYHVARI